jgi:hypothetical protein
VVVADFLVRLFDNGVDDPKSRKEAGDIVCVYEDGTFKELPAQDYPLGMLTVKNMILSEGNSFVCRLHNNKVRQPKTTVDPIFDSKTEDIFYETIKPFRYKIDFKKMSISDKLKLTRGRKILKIDRKTFKHYLKEKI